VDALESIDIDGDASYGDILSIPGCLRSHCQMAVWWWLRISITFAGIICVFVNDEKMQLTSDEGDQCNAYLELVASKK
jgi:hypothetical protein